MYTAKPLNLPEYDFPLKNEKNVTYIFDTIRKKWLVLTPEEWVRQHFVNYLVNHKNYPASLISLESGLSYNKRSKRSDILVYNKDAQPFLIIECKAAHVPINQNVIDQVSVYNKTINAKFVSVSNGLVHYFWSFNSNTNQFDFLKDVPDFEN